MLSVSFLAHSFTLKSAVCIHLSKKKNQTKPNRRNILVLLYNLLKMLCEKYRIPLFLWWFDALWVSSLSHFSLPQEQANKLVSIVMMVSWCDGLMTEAGQCLAGMVVSCVRPADVLSSPEEKTSWEAHKAFLRLRGKQQTLLNCVL